MEQLTKTLSSLEVAEMVGKQHKELLRDIRTYISHLNESKDALVVGERKIALTDFFIESCYKTLQNKKLPCYLLTKKGCELVANKLTGEKGTRFTATYVNKFNEMEQQNISVEQLLQDPDTIIRLATNWKEEKTKRLMLEEKIEQDKPYTEFGIAIGNASEAVKIGTFAKSLANAGIDTGQNRLFKWLRVNGYLESNNEPYQRYVSMGLFKIKVNKVKPAYGDPFFTYTTLITGKGQKYFYEKLKVKKQKGA